MLADKLEKINSTQGGGVMPLKSEMVRITAQTLRRGRGTLYGISLHCG